MASTTPPWFESGRRKLIRTLAFLTTLVALIWAGGQLWILQSEPYKLGRAAIASRMNADPEVVQLKRLAPFQFSDGSFSGTALFVLCAPDGECFTVVAKKRDAHWSVVDLVRR